METTVVTEGETPAAESEEQTWESVLSDVRTELQSGFARLEATLREGMENPRLVETLTAANTSLTGQITEMNRELVSRLDSLTRQPLEPIVVVAETPLTDTLPLVDGEIVQPEVIAENDPPPVAPRKRRTI